MYILARPIINNLSANFIAWPFYKMGDIYIHLQEALLNRNKSKKGEKKLRGWQSYSEAHELQSKDHREIDPTIQCFDLCAIISLL